MRTPRGGAGSYGKQTSGCRLAHLLSRQVAGIVRNGRHVVTGVVRNGRCVDVSWGPALDDTQVEAVFLLGGM